MFPSYSELIEDPQSRVSKDQNAMLKMKIPALGRVTRSRTAVGCSGSPFSKSARSDARPLSHSTFKDKPALYFPRNAAHRPSLVYGIDRRSIL